MKKISHYDKKGRVRMVDVTAKPATARVAEAHAFVRMRRATVASFAAAEIAERATLWKSRELRESRRRSVRLT